MELRVKDTISNIDKLVATFTAPGDALLARDYFSSIAPDDLVYYVTSDISTDWQRKKNIK